MYSATLTHLFYLQQLFFVTYFKIKQEIKTNLSLI